MATKKKAKAAVKKVVTAEQKKKIEKAFKNVEAKLLTNYKNLSAGSGKSLGKEAKKIRQNIGKAKKRVEVEVRKNPAGATIAAAVLGALAGAIIMSKLKKK
jgi:hypothetical protein